MEEIIITVRTSDRKDDYAVTTDMELGDLIDQLCARGVLPSGELYTVMKSDSDLALDLTKTMSDNNIQNGDVLDVAVGGTAG